MKATPTMTPRQLAEWERRARAGEDVAFATVTTLERHGTHHSYGDGCRCETCMAFMRGYWQRRAEKNRNTKPVAGHATGSVAR